MNQKQGGGQKPQQMTQNEAASKTDRLSGLLATLTHRKAELSAVLPPDLSFDAFHATVNQALRSNPDLLDCEPRSLVNACVKAAYDGLRIDGREAAIVYDMMTQKGGGRRVKMARYMPMYQGLVQQVLRGGMVLGIEADVAYSNDVFRIVGGTDRKIIHEVCLTGDRGEMIAAYSIATLPSGLRVSAYLLKADIIEIQKMSQSGWKDGKPAGVWAKWPREQWKKTILRQHRKTLPIGLNNRINDSEQEDDFPQFAPAAAHPQIGSAPPQPTRAMIENRQGTEAGNPMDFGGGFDGYDGYDGETGELIENQRGGGEQQQRADLQDGRQNLQAENLQDQQQAAPAVELPADGAEWAMWEDEFAGKLRKAETVDAMDAIWNAEKPIYDKANKATRDRLTKLMTDRTSDFALDGGE